jgi:uncharacterized protein
LPPFGILNDHRKVGGFDVITSPNAAGAAGAPAILAGAAHAEDQPAESTIDRIKRTKMLRIAALPGEAPYMTQSLDSHD